MSEYEARSSLIEEAIKDSNKQDQTSEDLEYEAPETPEKHMN